MFKGTLKSMQISLSHIVHGHSFVCDMTGFLQALLPVLSRFDFDA